MNYVPDTHSLIWYFTDDSRLSKRALKAFEGTTKDGRIIVPAVVMAEILFISRKGRVAVGFAETIARIEAMDNFEIAPLDVDVLRMPTEVDALLGDAAKARRALNWQPKVSFEQLIDMMIAADLEIAQKEKTLIDAGYVGGNHRMI